PVFGMARGLRSSHVDHCSHVDHPEQSTPDDDAIVDEIAAEILAYLEQHPEAADTLEGVVQWWILQQRFLRGIQSTNRALEGLVAQGQLERVRSADGRTIYRGGRPPRDSKPAP